jgi:hypothetical protein
VSRDALLSGRYIENTYEERIEEVQSLTGRVLQGRVPYCCVVISQSIQQDHPSLKDVEDVLEHKYKVA